MEAMTSDRNAFQELLKTNGISTGTWKNFVFFFARNFKTIFEFSIDIQQLMSQSLSKGFTKFHRLVQNDHLEASNTQVTLY